MPRRTAIDVRQPSDQTSNRQKWRVSLTEDAFESFMARCGDAGREVFGEGSLFSPMLFGKFFDPSDAFPLWEFDSDDLLSALRCSSKTSVDWAESSSEFILRAHVPGARKCEVEICGEKPKVVMEISGQWGPAVREPGRGIGGPGGGGNAGSSGGSSFRKMQTGGGQRHTSLKMRNIAFSRSKFQRIIIILIATPTTQVVVVVERGKNKNIFV
uniref:SHSP domain-containing protein n=1 Tax=Ananas comosus var. bracteatus TaxID=296719 RepID=A0A6V7NLQ3_ANACO|nr:unnamed protein product [Ananas comosus var. bracteatus]